LNGAEKRPHFKFGVEYLALCNFFFFPKIKDEMRGITFSSRSKAVEHYKNLVSEVRKSGIIAIRSRFMDYKNVLMLKETF
jgi:hypothetical protein